MSTLRRFQGKDNALLVEFEMLADMDLGLWRYIKQNYYDDPSVNQEFLDYTNETKVAAALISRSNQNPLSLIAPLCDYDALYHELMKNHELEILQCSEPYSLFGLLHTLNEEASSVKIDILCQNTIEQEYIKTLSSEFDIIVSKKSNVDLSSYSAVFMKYIKSFTDYPEMRCKYVYIANAGFNVEPELYCVNIEMGSLIEKENIVKSIDLYTYIRYLNFPLESDKKNSSEEVSENESESLLQYSQQ